VQTRSSVQHVLARIGPIRRLYLYAKLRGLFREFSQTTGASERFELRWSNRLTRLDDATPETPFDRHYIYHVGWASRVLAETHPTRHIDIGSSLFFASIASAFVPMAHYDYRPPDLELKGLQIGAGDLLALPFEDETVESISCLHVLEHVGLGRYGDRLSATADLEAAKQLTRVVAPGGALLIAVPVGKPRIAFNAHRVYSFGQVTQMFAPLQLREFALVPEEAADGGLLRDASPTSVATQTYGCGCFWFQRPPALERV
jgi:SAM-dependent methyltransferase